MFLDSKISLPFLPPPNGKTKADKDFNPCRLTKSTYFSAFG